MKGQGTLVTMSKWSKLKTLNKMVAKDKDEEEEEEEPVCVTKFEKGKTVPRNFYLGLRLKRIGLDVGYGTD